MVGLINSLKRNPDDVIISCGCDKEKIGLTKQLFESGKYNCPACKKEINFDPNNTVIIEGVIYSRYNKLGGWLLIPAIGIALGVLLSIKNAFGSYKIYKTGLFEPGLGLPIIFLYVIIFISFLITSGFFYNKYKLGVKLLILTYLIICLASILEFIALREVIQRSSSSYFNTSEFQSLIFTIIFYLFWSVYFLKSKRVKRTFR
ncbi:MAG: DUF2569 domain-containing protein [Chlorobi bacterium]|nr:DUF2569 domain-containing protein [Chlorobiota bacterium]MCI0716267.1 DUF2569 domain-containing protein [Chlorobiota bacterium]